MTEIIVKNSNVWGEFYTNCYGDNFEYGKLVKIYTNYSIRLFTIDKHGQLFKGSQSDFGTIFLNKEQWRSQKLNDILN